MLISPQLVGMLHYLKGIYNVRNSAYSFINDSRGITTNDPIAAHKALLSYLHIAGKENCLVYKNELNIIRDLGDVNNNEVKKFLETVPVWDVLVMSPYVGNDLEAVDGLDVVKKRAGAPAFEETSVYIASSTFMRKVSENNLSSLSIYVYTDPFLDSSNDMATTNRYDICEVVGIQKLNSTEIKYEWREMDIS